MATVVGIIIVGVFLLIVGGTIVQALSDVFLSLLSWAIILGLIVAGICLGQINPLAYILSAIGLCLLC